MSQRMFFTPAFIMMLAPAAARAQADSAPDVEAHRAEVGAFYTGVNLEGFGETVGGLGGRFGYNFNRDFALDAGGVLELYPSARTIVRLDAGDTIVRIRNATLGVLAGGPTATSDTTHNFQFGVGFGYRFQEKEGERHEEEHPYLHGGARAAVGGRAGGGARRGRGGRAEPRRGRGPREEGSGGEA